MKQTWAIEMEKDLNSDSALSTTFTLHCGSHILGATFTKSEAYLSDWLRSNCHRRSELIGISLLRGTPSNRSSWELKGPTSHPSHRSNPISFMALCFGDDILLYQNRSSRLGARPNKIKELRDLFADKRVRVAGVGLKADLEALKKEWDVYVANPIELKGGGKGEKVEEICQAVLGVKLGKRPARLTDVNWGSYGLKDDEEAMMYAARDAFVCFEIGQVVAN